MRICRFYIFLVLILSTAASLFSGCNKSEIIDGQKKAILTWIEGKDYAEVAKGVYRNIAPPDDGAGTPFAKDGDYMSITVRIYMFSSGFTGSQDQGGLIYTNQQDLIPKGVVWSPEPIEFILGEGTLMSGVEKSLIGAAPKDTVTVLMTSDNAYGNNQIQQMPANTPIAWIITVNEVSSNFSI